MYRYDTYDHQIVQERVAQFRDQVRRRLTDELSEDEFRPLRLQNGLYMQRHAYMLRVAIPYGLLSSKQLRMLAHIARKYDRDYGHFTTRQNIQYNWVSLEQTPDILADLASVEMHAIQTSGNCIRNITSDQFAGVAADELLDPRPYAEILRQWSSFHPEFAGLPRKFKFAVSGSKQDRALVQAHDIGLEFYLDDAGKLAVRVWSSLLCAALALPVALWAGNLSLNLWLLLAGFALLSFINQLTMVVSYEISDFSHAYPVARGVLPP